LGVAQDFELDSLFGPTQGPSASEKATVSAALLPGEKKGVVVLAVKMVVPPGANIYSQSPDFSKPTVIKVANAKGWTPLDKAFIPDHPAKKAFDENFDKEVEKFFGTVLFKRRYLAPSAVDPKQATLKGTVDYLICKELCVPGESGFTAAYDADGSFLAGGAATDAGTKPTRGGLEALPPPEVVDLSPPPVEEMAGPGEEGSAAPDRSTDSSPTKSGDLTYAFRVVPKVGRATDPSDAPARLNFELTSGAQVGDKVTVAISMLIEENWSTYGLEKASEDQVERPTQIKFTGTGLQPIGTIASSPQPEVHETKLGNLVTKSNAHTKQVTWRQEFEVTDLNYGVTGSINYQICESGKSCLAPKTVPFSLGAGQNRAHLAEATAVPKSFLTSGADEFTIAEGEESVEAETLAGALGLAFLAGLILNIMPCILPVLAIKILSFVQQAGESHLRIIALNTAYTAGVLLIFFLFGLTSVIIGGSIEEIFQNDYFWMTMAGVIFAMALSLFGVFELPVPGLIPSANDHSEGYLGAFNTGIIATILGTPCIGPFIVPFWAFTLKQEPPTVFLIFGTMGIGMASPFLLTGIFPGLVKWLPRPGMWMVKFKQFCGFVMMGTVIWALYSISDDNLVIPMLIFMLGGGLFLWMSSNLVEHHSPASTKRWNFVASVAAAAPIVAVGVWWVTAGHGLPWQEFNEDEIIAMRQKGKPMLIDFTADWCAICKLNEARALNRTKTIEFMEEHDIVPIMADFTKQDEEIKKWLTRFGQESVPLTIIIPPGKNSKIIPLRGRYFQGQLLDALERAMAQGNEQKLAEPGIPSPDSETAQLQPVPSVVN